MPQAGFVIHGAPKADKLDPAVRSELSRPFHADIAELESITGWDLADWRK
jgi:hypothetical protein